MKSDEITFYTYAAAHRFFIACKVRMVYTSDKLVLTLKLKQPARLVEPCLAIVLHGIEFECDAFLVDGTTMRATIKRINSDMYSKQQI